MPLSLHFDSVSLHRLVLMLGVGTSSSASHIHMSNASVLFSAVLFGHVNQSSSESQR